MIGLEPIRLAAADFKSAMSAIPSHPQILDKSILLLSSIYLYITIITSYYIKSIIIFALKVRSFLPTFRISEV